MQYKGHSPKWKKKKFKKHDALNIWQAILWKVDSEVFFIMALIDQTKDTR